MRKLNGLFDTARRMFMRIPGKRKHIIAFAVELVLIAALVTVSSVGVYNWYNPLMVVERTAAAKPSGQTSSAVLSSAASSDVSSASSAQTSVNTAGSTQTVSMPDNIIKNVLSGNMLTWSKDRMLPALNNAAPVLDYIDTSHMSNDEILTFTTLKGIVNRKQPRIFTFESDPAKGVSSGWVVNLGLKFNRTTDPYSLVKKYKNEIKGMIIYDNTSPLVSGTINLATTIAGVEGGIVVSPAIAQKLSKSYGLKTIIDLRKMFTNNWQVYQYEYDHYASKTTNRVIVELPTSNYGNVRDYAVAIRASVVSLDPNTSKDRDIFDKFLGRMEAGNSVVLGWWPSELDCVAYASTFGVVTVASDYSPNLSVYAGMPTKITPQKTAAAPKLENKIYISLAMSDGDNIQYDEKRMLDLWNQPERTTVPISWTISPALYDVETPILNYFLKTASANDCFIGGPSAYGYTYPKVWSDRNALKSYLKKSDNYMKAVGLRLLTVWDGNAGSMLDNGVVEYAQNMTSLLGITQQESMKKPIRLVNGRFLCLQLDAAYCSTILQMKNSVTPKIQSFDGTKPVFITVQAEPWDGINLSDFKTAATYYQRLSPYVQLVRYDQLFELETQYLNSKR